MADGRADEAALLTFGHGTATEDEIVALLRGAGVALAGLIGVRNALVVGGAMRLIGVLMFWVFPVEKERLTWQGVRKGLGALRPGKGGVV